MECANCYVKDSPQWRTLNDDIYCNACCIYHKRWKKHKEIEKIYAKILINIKHQKK